MSIRLESAEEIAWWASFADRDCNSQDWSSLRKTVDLREVLVTLGARDSDAAATTVRLNQGAYIA